MYWKRFKTAARCPDCEKKGNANDPCSTHIHWCEEADKRGSPCAEPIQTSQGSSTKRHMNCPKHR
ncbi:hypothetical protein BU26DRAFT_512773 [Trematosphaeria pertusa]|uniref:Uncharacterized protein n=1 Tax=Trematosphaeria pertusa TaxID=390896 RepID=A0A6A6IZF0_9PLEO|nr:uncharacterized protein BU26DRAFT_512773 [Trematosphaeria pertusa]KAF2255819.1 hypothetical protein BU26DRAFT_512773 [Trematosphaeria pertusa]